ncbi:MAG: FecR domain-containing protein [Rhodospirillales bacterium]|nr:FecR domain-containing protein [Rhodospirillales bacterium]
MNTDLIAQIRDLASTSHPLRLNDPAENSAVSDASHISADTDGPLILGDQPWFLRADFARDGADLKLTGEDGQIVIIDGYFAQANPPDLASGSGAVVNAATAARLAGPLAPGQYAQAAPGLTSDPIGRVETASGTIKATRADGTEVNLAQGDPVYLGDILETGSDAAVGITFADESTFSLGEDGRLTLDDMIYDPGGQTGSMQVNLLQGAFTFVSGQIAKTDPNAMVVTTPTSTIGIRGTAGGGTVDANGGTTAALMPEANGFTGEMSIGNAAGFQIINQPLQAVYILDINSPPSPPFVMTLQQMGQTFGRALGALPNAGLALPGDVISGANEGRNQQIEAEQAAQEAQASQDEAEALAAEAEALAEEAAAEVDAALAAETEAADAAAAAEAAAAEALAAAEAAAIAAADPGATEEEIIAAEDAALQAAEAQAVAEEQATVVQEARAISAQTQVQAAQAESELAAANAQVAKAAVVVSQSLAAVLQSSPTGAIVNAARAAGINTLPGSQQLDDAQAAVTAAEARVVEAELQLQDAEAAAQEAEAVALAITGEIQGESGNAGDQPPAGGPDDGGQNSDGDPGDQQADGQIDGEITQQNALDPTNGPLPGTDPELDPFDLAGFGDPFNQPAPGQTAGGLFFTEPLPPPDTGPLGPLGTDPEDNVLVVDTFTENLNATVGDDFLVGGPGNTQFTMIQDSTLDGTDLVDGGAGTDELYLDNLTAFEGIFDATNAAADPTLTYSSNASGISGTITLSSVEQLYANDGMENNVRLNIGDGSVGYGYIVAGDDGIDTINVSDTSSLSELGHTIYDVDMLGTILFGRGGDDHITGSGREDVIFGGTGNDTLIGGAGNDTLSGGAGNDTFTAEGSDTIDGGAGTDSLTLSAYGDSVTVSNVETITGGAGNDYLTMTGASVTNAIVDLAAGVDTVELGDFTNSATLTNTETVYGGTGTDSLTIGDATDSRMSFSGTETITSGAGNDFIAILDGLTAGSSMDSGGGTDSIKLADTANNTTLNDIKYINGGSAIDTLTLTNTSVSSRIDAGGGADSIDLTGVSGGRQTVVIDKIADFGDVIDGFQEGAGNDVIDFNATLSRGNSNAFETLSVGNAVGAHTVFVTYTTVIASYSDATAVALALDTLSGLSAGNAMLFAVGNLTNTNTHLWYWQGSGDGSIDAAELTSVAELTGVDNTSLVVDNFASETLHNTTGIQGVTMTAHGVDNIITGDGGNENVTLTGAAETGDSYDGLGGTDTLNLDDVVNTIAVANTETINGGNTTDEVTLDTALSGGSIDLMGGDHDVLILADGTNSIAVSNTETVYGGTGADTLTPGAAGTMAFYGGAGADSVTLANGTNRLTTTNVETIIGGTGDDTIKSSGTVSSISGGDGNDMIKVTGSNGTLINGGAGDDTLIGGTGSDTLTGGTGSDIFKYTAINQAGISLSEAITDFDANAADQFDISEIHLAGSFSYGALANDGNASAFLSGTLLEFDTSGDGSVDMEIEISGYSGTLDTTDFITV